jgi:hypothetical protein
VRVGIPAIGARHVGHARGRSVGEVGRDQPRLQQDHVDAEAAQLEAQRVGDRLQRVLARVVVAAAGKRKPAAHRADVDDLAPVLGTHLSQHQLGEAHGPEDVGLELAPNGLQRNGLDRSALAVAGVVDEHPDRALGLLDRLDGRVHRGLVGHIQRQRVAAGVAELGDRLGSTRGGVDAPSGARESQRRGPSDARGAAGYQYRLGSLGHATSIGVRVGAPRRGTAS